jgi:hypothetical protein
MLFLSPAISLAFALLALPIFLAMAAIPELQAKYRRVSFYLFISKSQK